MPKNFAIVCLVAILVAACSTGGAERLQSLDAVASPVPQASTAPSPTPSSAIRLIDFANFTYPGKPVFMHGLESFTLHNGKSKGDGEYDSVGLAFLDYGDATGDGAEEAIAVIYMSVRGSAIPYSVYIYTLKDGMPRLLWAFPTGDRADGGLRQVQAAGGELVIELYGKGKMIGKDLYAEDGMTGGDCCPTHFTRVTYEWRRNTFDQKTAEEILANPTEAAPVVMSR